MRKLFALVIFLIVIAIAIFGGSPYYSAYQLKNAYEDKEGAIIAAAIDYEQLRPSMKTQLTIKFADTLSQYPLIAELGGAPITQAADDFIVEAVDSAITPDNITRLIDTQGQANSATKNLAAAWAIASNQIDLQALIRDMITQRGDMDAVIKNQVQTIAKNQSIRRAQQIEQNQDTNETTLNYCGVNCFTISGQVKSYPITVVMARDGLIHWKIVDIILP